MSKHFDKFEERINSVTDKFVVAEQSPERMTMFAAEKNLKNALANPTKQFTFPEIRNIWFAFNTLGGEKVNQIAARYPEGTLQTLTKTLDTETGVPNDIVTKARKLASENNLDGLRELNGGVIPGFDKIDKAGRMRDLIFKDVKRFADTVIDYINKGIPGRQRGEADPQRSMGAKFTLGQLKAALDLADGKDVSVREALGQIAKREVTQEEAQEVFDSANDAGEELTVQLNKLWNEAQDKVDDLKKEFVNHERYTGTGPKEANLQALTVSDMFRVRQAEGPAYRALRQWSLEGNPSYQQRLISLLPTFEAVTDVISQLMKRQDEFATTQAARKAAAILKIANQAHARFNLRDLNIANRVAAARGAEDQDFYGDDDDAPLSQGEQGYRDQDFFGADDDAPLSQAERGARDQDLYGGDADQAATAGIAAGRAADDQDFYGPDDDKPYDQRYDAERDQDFYGPDDDKPFDPRYDVDKDQDFLGPDDDKPFDPRYDVDKDQDFLGDPEVGPEGGTGVGRSDERGGYLEMARREFDKALANTKGPTRGDGALETARRIYDTAIKNTPGPTRGNYGARLEMSRRAYLQAIKNTLDTGRGSGFKEMARRAFDTALKNTLDTGRGSGESQVDRRFVDNVRSDIDQWMNRNRAPGETTGGFVGVSTPGDESDRPTGEEQIEAQQELHRKIVNMFDDDRGQARASYILRLVRELNSSDSKLLDPESREKYINNLKQTYVKYKAQEDFLSSQDGNPILYYGFNPGNLNSVEGVRGKSNFNLSDSILYSLELLTQVVPDAIQKHSTKQSVIDANPPVDLDKDDLNQQAQARTAKLDQAAQELRDQGAARSAAGEEELANRDEIRARAEETAEQERERRRIIASQLKTFKEIEAETTNKEAAFDAVIEPLDALISNVEADVPGTQISSLANLQALLDSEYTEKADIINNAITGKEEFEELDERLYNVVVEKLTQFNETTNTVLDQLKAESEGSDAGINAEYIFSIDTASMRADVDAFSTLKDMPNNFVSVATKRIDQIDSFVDALQRRYNFYNDEFMVLHREVNEAILSSWDDINNFEYDELIDLYEDIEELFELSQATGRSSREQQIVDNKYSAVETNIGKLIQRKALDFGKRAVDVYNDIVTKTRIDAVDIVEGDLVLTPEAFDELYTRRDEVDGLIEEFETVQEFLETVDTEEPEFFTKVQPWLDTLVGFYQIIEQYAAGRGGPNRRGSPSDAYRYYKEILGKVREPARAGFAGRGAPSPEAREALAMRNIMRPWKGSAVLSALQSTDGLPDSNNQGSTKEGDRKKQHRSDVRSLINEQGREAMLQLLASRRAWQLLTGNFVDNPHQDVFIKTSREAMRREQGKFEDGEITDLQSARKAIAYLDKLKDQYYG